MNLNQQINYQNKSYKILAIEQEYIIHPAAFGLLPLSKASLQTPFSCDYRIEDYRLILDKLTLTKEDGSLNQTKPESSEKQFEIQNVAVPYTGAILIGRNQGKDYYMKPGNLACFSYQNVLELVFEDGNLITTVDQSKAMLRIRKNLEIGLRSLNKSRDSRCINRFLNSSFFGDYKKFILNLNRIRYLKEMKKEYKDTAI